MPIIVTFKFEGEWFDLATFRTIRDFMSAVVTCKFEEPIKTEGTMPGTR